MICKSCGEFLSENENFCPNCGAKVEEEQVVASEEIQETDSWVTVPKTGEEEKGKEFGFEESIVGSAHTYEEEGTYEEESSYYESDTKHTIDMSFFEQIVSSLNEKLDPLIRTAVNTHNSFAIMFVIAALVGGVTSTISNKEMPGSLLGSIIGGLIGTIIAFLIQSFVIKYISRRESFTYGYADETKSERNILIILYLVLSNAVGFILAIIGLNKIVLLSLILGVLANIIILTALFYKYFRGDQMKRFAKSYFIFNLILEFIIIVIAGLFFALIIGMLGAAFKGLY